MGQEKHGNSSEVKLPRFYAPGVPRWDVVGMVGAAVIAGTVSLGIFGQNIGISMVLLAFVLQRPCWQWVFRLPEFWLACVVVVYIVACAWWASVVLPETASAQWEQAGRWIRLLLFLPFAYFFRRSKDALLWISAFFLFGLVRFG